MKKILILTDGKAGHENQSRAFARALGYDFDLLPVRFRFPGAKPLSYLFNRLGLSTSALFTLTDPPAASAYAAVIGTGSGTFYAAHVLSRQLNIPCGVVLSPRGYRFSSFDCILAPAFDRPVPAPNVITIPANLVAADAAFYETGLHAFRARYTPSDRPAVAVIVGGPNKCATLSPDWMRAQLEKIFAETPDCEHWVTTSRRTPLDVEAVVDAFPFDYKLLYSRDHFNPIPAFVTAADTLYVTAESTGMLSEACTFGRATVHALDNLMPGPSKFRRFIDGLTEAGHLNGNRKIDLTDAFNRARARLRLDAAAAAV